jgi:drug/metabolite transporter (DMT)-like permease
MVAGATLLWSVEVVAAKRLLAGLSSSVVAGARMTGGAVLLVVYGATQGNLGALLQLTPAQVWWALVTAGLLLCYVTTWYAALKRAPATAVTCVVTIGAPITALLSTLAGRAFPAPDQVIAYVLLTSAVVTFLALGMRTRAQALAPARVPVRDIR